MGTVEGVPEKLYLPLAARIAVSKTFPGFINDKKALEIEAQVPAVTEKDGLKFANLALCCRDVMVDKFLGRYMHQHLACNIVYLRAGLDTSMYRMIEEFGWREVHFYAVDTAENIAARRAVFGENPLETLVVGEPFSLDWADSIDTTNPTIFVVRGMFEDYSLEVATEYIKAFGQRFPGCDLVFDAVTEKGQEKTMKYMRAEGREVSPTFIVDDPEAYAAEVGGKLVDTEPMFQDLRKRYLMKIKMKNYPPMFLCDWRGGCKIIRVRF